MNTRQTNYRLPALTIVQLNKLADQWGMNRTQVLIRLIDRAAEVEKELDPIQMPPTRQRSQAEEVE